MADEFNNDSLLELYLYESTSLLDSLDTILLKAEAEGVLASENINEIFRIMHTIKGSSAMMAYTGVAEVAHKIEDLFAMIRESGLNMACFNELFDVVLAASDFLKTEISKVQAGQPLETEVAPLTAVVIGLMGKMRGEAQEEAPEPEQPAQTQPEPQAYAESQPQTYAEPQPPVYTAPEGGRMLGAEPAYAEPQPQPQPEPAYVTPDPPPMYMPEAPEGGRILGAEPPRGAAALPPDEPDELAADLSGITARASENPAEPGAKDTYYLHVHFNEGSKMENIRAFMLINKLSEKGNVNQTVPANPETNPDAANRIVENGFYISYSTTLFREQIETLIKGTLSVEAVSFVRKLPYDPDAPEAAQEPPKPTLRPQPIAAPQEQHIVPPPTGERQPQRPVFTDAPQQQQQPQQPTQSQQQTQQQQPTQPQRPVFVDVTQRAPAPQAPVQPRPAEQAPAAPPPVQEAPIPAPVQRLNPAHPVSPQAPNGQTPQTQTPQAPVRQEQSAQTVSPQAPNEQTPREQEKHAPSASGEGHPGKAGDAHLHGAPGEQSFINVELQKLDALLDLVGEIVINESLVTENPELEGIELTNFRKASRQLDKLTSELQDTVMAIRMLPVSMVFQRMGRIVRDMSKSLCKEASLILVGEATEVDKTIIDALANPIMHLVRNAMDHAIETPEERVAAGKASAGHIILSAQNSGGDVIISVSDDGKGLDKTVILNKARKSGLLRKPESEYTDREIFNLLMAPGFSTRENVSEYSGRGVGLDVVKSNIEKIGGDVTIESKAGQGANIIMKIPLTLAIVSCIEIAIGQNVYALPINNIRESFKSNAGQLITDPTGSEMIMLRGQPYPIIRLYERFGHEDAITDISDGILVLANAGEQSVCLLADRLVGKYQVVVKPLPAFLNRFGRGRSGVSGCTIMGNGEISLILNAQDFIG